MKNKLSAKLLASFTAVLILFATIMGMVFTILFSMHTVEINKNEMKKKAVSIAQTLSGFTSGASAHGMGRKGMGGYGAYLRFLDELAMAEVWIVDENMSMLTYGHGQLNNNNYESLPDNAEEIVQKVFAGEVTYGKEFSELLFVPTLTVGAPIMLADGSVSGAVLLHSPISGINEAVGQGITALIIGAVIALVFAISAALLLAHILTKSLNKMTDAALCLVQGDYTAKVIVDEKDEIGELARVLNLLSDRLLEAEQQRKAVDKLRDDFITNVSHELRTPIAVLRGSLEMLQNKAVKTPDETVEYYTQMLNESKHLERLVNDLLDLSRLQDAGFALELSEVNLCDIVRDVARSMRRLSAEKHITIETQCPKTECMVTGDYGRLRQMLYIIMDNAIKFSFIDGIVILSLKNDNEKAVLSVTDYGTAISNEELPFIFERFKKAYNEQNIQGTGLGLAIAKQISERHKAQISAESDINATVFTVSFTRI